MANEMRLIDANDLWQKTFICEEPGDFRKAIENAPTVDAVPVVRCKDCKHFVSPQGVPCCDNFFGLGFPHPSGDNFCSYGERREGE